MTRRNPFLALDDFVLDRVAQPGLDPRPVEMEFPMPDLATCEAKGRALAANNDATRTFRFVCRRTT